jgi:hypothetical protein
MRFFPNTYIGLIRLEFHDFIGFHTDFPRQQFRVLGPATERHLDMATGEYHGRQLAVHLLERMTGAPKSCMRLVNL